MSRRDPFTREAEAPGLPRAMRDALRRYLDHLRAVRGASPYTLRNYGGEIGDALAQLAAAGVRRWSDVDRSRLRDWLAGLHGQGYAPSSIARRVSELRAFGAFLHRESLAPDNPFASLRAPRVPSRLPRVLSVAEVAALVESPPPSPLGLRDRAILETLYGGGLRVAELTRLDLADVEPDARRVRVTGKGNRERVALVGRPCARALTAYLRVARPELRRRDETRGPRAPLFLNARGGRLSDRSVQRIVAGAAQSVGLEDVVTPHVLRHTFATHLMDGGADLRDVQELLGHRSLRSTQVYTHVSQTRAKASYLAAHPMAAGRPAPPDPEG